jgi:protein-S-isoprenylcysteine O-methyltransferase Ste14
MLLYLDILSTVLLIIVAVGPIRRYRGIRANRSYAEGRTPVNRQKVNYIDKYIFYVLLGLTMSSIWFDWSVLAKLHDAAILRLFGMLIATSGTALLLVSLNHLSQNYSPIFDAHLPYEIISSGPYRFIRHPIYASHHLICIGLTCASASLWALAYYGYMCFRQLPAIQNEEIYLKDAFPEYKAYMQRSRRLIPYIY